MCVLLFLVFFVKKQQCATAVSATYHRLAGCSCLICTTLFYFISIHLFKIRQHSPWSDTHKTNRQTDRQTNKANQ